MGHMGDSRCVVTSYLCLYLIEASMHRRATSFMLSCHHWWLLNITKVDVITKKTKKRRWRKMAYSLPWILPLLGHRPWRGYGSKRSAFRIHCMLPPRFSLRSDLISEWLLLALPALPSLAFTHMVIYHWKSYKKGVRGDRFMLNYIHMKFTELFVSVGLCNIVGGFLVTLSNSLFNTKFDIIVLCLGTSLILLTPDCLLIFSPAFKCTTSIHFTHAVCVHFGWIEESDGAMETKVFGAPVLTDPSPQGRIVEFLSALKNPRLSSRITNSLPFPQTVQCLRSYTDSPLRVRLLGESTGRDSTPDYFLFPQSGHSQSPAPGPLQCPPRYNDLSFPVRLLNRSIRRGSTPTMQSSTPDSNQFAPSPSSHSDSPSRLQLPWESISRNSTPELLPFSQSVVVSPAYSEIRCVPRVLSRCSRRLSTPIDCIRLSQTRGFPLGSSESECAMRLLNGTGRRRGSTPVVKGESGASRIDPGHIEMNEF
ncbi:hypothetical protein CAPTEDRAFT_196888 [Capitella teleta]|uniref:Uncharacterized protein n=1 Tax=Capitella teleta TaxID=283909 RepID=R7UUG6_CAPTE|nr:hypothetical protein CAPTEDRAFT_196888 [Capitella teleta]|eukprot:ELU09835.1 hypothetical protein CAPTEDRAFT_196888 [Capitella teleta]